MNASGADRLFRSRITPLKSFFIILRFFFVFFFTLALTGMLAPLTYAAESKINCRVHDGPCSQSLPTLEIKLDITPKPVKAMQDLVFKVVLAGEGPDGAPYIDLEMPGMEMGPNRVNLKQTSRNVYEGKGVIVRCPTGDHTWQATVTIPGKGRADFIFDVVH